MLSLSELREALKLRGVEMSLPSLSEFIKTGEIADVLNVGGKANRLEIPEEAAEVLAAFWPEYKAAHGRLPQAERLLRSFLNNRILAPDDALSIISDIRTAPKQADSRQIALLCEIVETLKAIQRLDPDTLLTLKEAKDRTGVPMRVLRTLPRYWGKVSMQDVQARIQQEKGKA